MLLKIKMISFGWNYLAKMIFHQKLSLRKDDGIVICKTPENLIAKLKADGWKYIPRKRTDIAVF